MPLPPLTVIGAPNGLLLLEIVADPAGEDALEALAQAVREMETAEQGVGGSGDDAEYLLGAEEGEDAHRPARPNRRAAGMLLEAEASENSDEGAAEDGAAAAAWRAALHGMTGEPGAGREERVESRMGGSSWGSIGWQPDLGNSGLDLSRDWRQRVQVR
jgi:hypothetical protein